MFILIVEDDADMAEALTLTVTLHWADCEVTTATDGGQALDILVDRTPEFVLLDIGLPRRDGFDVLRDLRLRSQVPVMIITARGDELDRVRGLELGADDYVLKPFSPVELMARIRRLLHVA